MIWIQSAATQQQSAADMQIIIKQREQSEFVCISHVVCCHSSRLIEIEIDYLENFHSSIDIERERECQSVSCASKLVISSGDPIQSECDTTIDRMMMIH